MRLVQLPGDRRQQRPSPIRPHLPLRTHPSELVHRLRCDIHRNTAKPHCPLTTGAHRLLRETKQLQKGCYHFTLLHEHTEVLIKKHFSHSLIVADITQYHVTGRRPMSARRRLRRGPSLGAGTQRAAAGRASRPRTNTTLSSFYSANKCHMISRRR